MEATGKWRSWQDDNGDWYVVSPEGSVEAIDGSRVEAIRCAKRLNAQKRAKEEGVTVKELYGRDFD